jgi:shikimate dehydrogenase
MRLGVVGWPVAHSLSPIFQTAALRAARLTGWRYGRLPLPPELFDETVRALPTTGYRGVNVTIPHKERALALADVATERATAIGAANTLVFSPDGIAADNTDSPGLISLLPDRVAGIRAQILGAGGTARAALWALLDAGAAEVMVWNRSAERSRRLCASLGGQVVARPEPADLLVNCTSVGLCAADRLEDLLLDREELRSYPAVVDFVYRRGGSVLTRAAREAALETVDGFELLIAQGALSFEQFTGLPAPVAAMRHAIGLG